MALLERVATLLRANLNDLIDRAEDPEKMLKQVILDMQNQLIQVKTQVAIAIADQHILAKKLQENEQTTADWMRKAELAVERQQDQLARPALERVISYRQLSMNFREQLQDQNVQVENLKSALQKLDQKLVEAQNRSEILAARHRRARTIGKAADARASLSAEGAHATTLGRMSNKVLREEATSLAKSQMLEDNPSQQLLELDKQDQVEQMLQAIKTRKAITA
jgi:phage shock protein A